MTKLYQLTPDESQWRLATIQVFDYPSRQDVEAAIRSVFPAP